MGNTLKFLCPHCNSPDYKEVIKTDSKYYDIFSKQTESSRFLIREEFGVSRRRFRKCSDCGREITTHEVCEEIIDELNKLFISERRIFENHDKIRKSLCSEIEFVVALNANSYLLAGCIQLVCDVFGAKYGKDFPEIDSLETAFAIFSTVRQALSTLLDEEVETIIKYYRIDGIEAEAQSVRSSVSVDTDVTLSSVLRKLKHPSSSRVLRQLVNPTANHS